MSAQKQLSPLNSITTCDRAKKSKSAVTIDKQVMVSDESALAAQIKKKKMVMKGET